MDELITEQLRDTRVSEGFLNPRASNVKDVFCCCAASWLLGYIARATTEPAQGR